jgi:hypothetical protein
MQQDASIQDYKYTGIAVYPRYRQYHCHCILNMAERSEICQHCYCNSIYRDYCAAMKTLRCMVRVKEACFVSAFSATHRNSKKGRQTICLYLLYFLFFLNFPASRVYLVGFNEELPGSGRKGWVPQPAAILSSSFFSFRLIQIPCSVLFLQIYALRNCISLEGGRSCQENFA